jgi:AmmeMemoRadiSam system protein A
MELDARQQKELLAVALASVKEAVAPSGQPLPDEKAFAPQLQEPGGAFVTLQKNGRLRGCIGTFVSQESLLKTVWQMASAAALHDPRFPPVDKSELDNLDLEISVLSPLKRATPEQIEVGKHGVFIISPRRRGVLLPQVATEHGWDQLTFLQQTCYKAGLSLNAWQDNDVEIYVFTAQVFA